MIETGFIIGTMSFLAIVILVEKLPLKIKAIAFGHHLLTDLLFTALAFTLFPVTGAATLLSASTFCLLFTVYIFIRRNSIPWKRIHFKGIKPRIIDSKEYNQLKSQDS